MTDDVYHGKYLEQNASRILTRPCQYQGYVRLYVSGVFAAYVPVLAGTYRYYSITLITMEVLLVVGCSCE
jgi:hypothetical protein